jgi:hypothetical protein
MTSTIVSPLESAVETHIDSTSRFVRQVDLAFSLLIVFSLLLGGLFLAIIADHWILKEGLSMLQRLGLFAALFATVGLYVYWKIVPILRYSINPIYTADLIEKDVSTFKNSLINWILLRQEREERADVPNEKIHDRMYDGIVKTAAVHVQTVPAGHAVDLRKSMTAGTIFTILLIGFIIYAALSPKSPFGSLARVLFPFGNIERPQAAQFRNVEPGDAVVLQGETISISAEVVSRSDEPVYLVFSTDDGQAVNQRIPMSLPEGKIKFETQFPPGKQGIERGFNSSVDYWIAQGESRSKQFRLDVQPAASVEIVSLQYDFPDYTGLPTEIVEHGGDIRALEGTNVTVIVRSTLPLQNIDLMFDDNPAHNVSVRITDAARTEAKGTFALKTPFPHQTFSFRATDENGHASRRSGIYRIEVIPDQPPKVQWADTAKHLMEPEIPVPLNETLQCPIQAEDPDFALRSLSFKTESPGKRIPDMKLLDSPTTGPTKHRGQIKQTVAFSPADKRLAVGDTAEIWVEATDTKLPTANSDSTRRIKIKVIDPKDKENKEQEQEQDGEKQPPEQDKQNDSPKKEESKTDKKNPDEKETEGEQGGGENGGSEQDPDNPDNEKNSNGGGEDDPGNQEEKEESESGQNNREQDNSTEDSPKENESQGNGGKAENDPSGEEQGKQPDNGKGGENEDGNQKEGNNDNTPENQPNEPQKGEGAGGKKTGNEREQDSSPNPDTQDADAMERVVEQMKEEGLFPGANPFLRNDNQRQRNDGLNPNSPNQTNKGNDPSNPKESNQQPKDGEPQKQQQNQPDKPTDGGSESGQAGEMDSQSGNQQGTPQQGQQDEGGQDEQGAKGEQGNQGEKGEQGTSGNQQSPNNNPQDSASENSQSNSGASSKMGGTGGGQQGASAETKPDDPNMEYANKETNMLLDYLENQLKDKPNDDLLKRLNWTEDELRRFYARWKKMSEDSKQPQAQEDGKNMWEEALKSTGKKNKNRRALQDSQTRKQDNQRVTEAQRIPVPPAIRKRYKDFNENVGK